ncbi:MAG: hypothetical protein JXR53_11470, partial [Bacteroidales bacterium]|nr:hypothetical protein [Bacteroidales bacterium]
RVSADIGMQIFKCARDGMSAKRTQKEFNMNHPGHSPGKPKKRETTLNGLNINDKYQTPYTFSTQFLCSFIVPL